MPQCNDSNCWCNRKPDPPQHHKPEGTMEIASEARNLIVSLGDDLEWANDTGLQATLDALDTISAAVVEIKNKIFTDFPWMQPK